jgi:hypothetical protein
VIGHKDLDREPRLRKVGAAALLAAALGVLVLGSPSMADRYQQLSFKRTEVVKKAGVAPLTLTHVYSADEMLSKRLVFTSPAEAFKARYQQSIKPVYLECARVRLQPPHLATGQCPEATAEIVPDR